jgi:hypothetical protein
MMGAFGQLRPPEDMRCRYVTCTSTLGKQWRGVVATDKDLWARLELRVCEECIQLLSWGEYQRGFILRMSQEGYLWFDVPWIQMLTGGFRVGK